jgi:hypothetical protein
MGCPGSRTSREQFFRSCDAHCSSLSYLGLPLPDAPPANHVVGVIDYAGVDRQRALAEITQQMRAGVERIEGAVAEPFSDED